jgi:hypothetical protein
LVSYIKHEIEAVLQIKVDDIKKSKVWKVKDYSGKIDFLLQDSVDSLVSKSMQEVPKEYEDLLRHYEGSIRQYIEQCNYYEI